MTSALLLIVVLGVSALMLWGSNKMEPHWVSKDGERMICFGQGMSRDGQPLGRWRELRISRVRNNLLEVRPRRGSLAVQSGGSMAVVAGLRPGRRGPRSSIWSVVGQTESTKRNRVLYILGGNHEPSMPEMIAISVPTKSRAIPMLESMATKPTTPTSTTSSTTLRSNTPELSRHPKPNPAERTVSPEPLADPGTPRSEEPPGPG